MPPYTLDVLAQLADTTPRTIRYYVSQGLLPAPEFAGPGTRYDDRHLALIRAIKRMQADHLPLAAIRERLRGLTENEIEQIASARATEPRAADSDALSYIRGVLGRPARAAPDPAPAAALRALADAPPPAPAPQSAPQSAPGDRSQWERIVLEPDIELHIMRPLSRQQNRRVERFMALARELMDEEE
jgi:DNA-binding transcriptional MerR regulator